MNDSNGTAGQNLQMKSTAFAGKEKQILFCGRLEYSSKRPDRILRIWSQIQAQLPDWELIIVGDGPESFRFRALAENLKLKRVRFEGFKNPVPYYKSASILAMTSNHEGFGLVLTEAMQYGCVPVAFESYLSVRDIIEHGKNGILVKPFDLKAYGEAIIELATTPGKLDRLSAATGVLDKFAPEEIGRCWYRILDDMAKSNHDNAFSNESSNM